MTTETRRHGERIEASMIKRYNREGREVEDRSRWMPDQVRHDDKIHSVVETVIPAKAGIQRLYLVLQFLALFAALRLRSLKRSFLCVSVPLWLSAFKKGTAL